MLAKLVGVCVLFSVSHDVWGAEEKIETSCNINGKKAIHCVSEKFLSISIDPAVLLAGVNLSETSLRLAQHLSPAYIRIAGPSTPFVQYVDRDDRFANYLSEDGTSVVVTPSMWFGINEWFRLANLMPVFGVNDADTAAGNWNPKGMLPLLEISDKLNVSCYWQLGYDSTNKTEMTYEQDLNILHDVLTGFPGRNETWKIVGSDISRISTERPEKTMEEIKDIVTAVMWEPSHITAETFPEKDMAYKILQRNSKPNVKIWTTVPKSSETVVFSSVLQWAKQIGNAAKTGYDVVFRQPRMHELFSDTPAYWFSLLHKKLMGSNVLEAKTTTSREGTNIFAHCTRKQNSFVRRGALTIMMVNDNEDSFRVKVKLGTSPPEKSMEVQIYILTAPGLNSTQILLNGNMLTPDMLKEKNPFEPKVRRAKTPSHISLSLPPRSVGFFVLPGARVPVCIDQEIETKLLLEEMEENQNIPLSEEVALKFGSRNAFVKNQLLEEITRKMKQEMMSDEKYYSHSSLKSKLADTKDKADSKGDKIDEKGRKFFIDRVKHKRNRDFEKKRDELRKFLMERSRQNKAEPKLESKIKEIDLTSREVEKILKDRARARAARRNVVFTDEELKALVHRASKKFYKAKIKRSIPSEDRAKRDINVRLLERIIESNPSYDRFYEDHHKQDHFDNDQMPHNAFIRKPRDINTKLVELKSKLAESKSKWEDKKEELLGNTQMARENIKDRIRKLKNKNRFRRDINMELLEVKSKPDKKSESERRRQKKKKEMEATMRQPGQTSAELLEQLEFEREQENNQHKVIPKTEIYAELADSEDLEAEELFKPTPKTKKLKLFDKKSKLDPFAITHPSIEIIEPPFKKSRKEKKKSKSRSDNLQFLTSSEEFTDIEDDLPCIHEYFGPQSKSESKKHKNTITELGELTSDEKMERKKNRKMKSFSEETSSEEDLSRRKRQVYLEPYIPTEQTEPMSRLDYLESILEKIDLKCSECGTQREHENESLERSKRGLYLGKGPQESTGLINRVQMLESLLAELQSVYEKCMNQNNGTNQNLPNSNEKSPKGEIEPPETPESLDTITRQKRGDKPLLGIDPTIIEDDIKDYKKDMKKHIKELKQIFEEDKLRYEEKKRKNKLKLLQLKKKQELELAKEAVDAISKVRKNETESGINLLENLRMIKEDLQHKKDKLDKLLLEDMKSQREERKDELKSKSEASFRKQNSLNKMDKNHDGLNEKPIIVRTTPNDVQRSEKIRTSENKNSPEVKVFKRSIFDGRSVFGNYLPLTPELRMWKPADIISMKREINPFSTNKLIPPNDLHIFKNIFDQNSFLNMRKKRSIDSSMENNENEIDVDFNEIKKESQRFWPVKKFNNGDLKFLLPNQDELEVDENDGVTEIKFLHHDDVRKPNHHELTGDSFDRYRPENVKHLAEYAEDIENAMIKDKEPKDTGVTEDSLFSYLFTNEPSEGLFEKSNSKYFIKDTTVNRENENDFDPTLEENKPKDLEVTEDSLFSYFFEDNPLEKSAKNDQLKNNIGEVETKNRKYHDFLNVKGFGKPKDNTATYDALLPLHQNDGFLRFRIKDDKTDKISPDEDKDVVEKEAPRDNVVTGKTLVSFLFNDKPPDNKTTDLFGKQLKNVTINTVKTIDNIHKLPLKQEKKMFEDLINNLTGFFSKLNKQIQSYVKQIMN